jgi:hypothetical protein
VAFKSERASFVRKFNDVSVNLRVAWHSHISPCFVPLVKKSGKASDAERHRLGLA